MKSKSMVFSFDTITLEGSLFVADLLEKAALGLASRQTSADYAVPRGLRLSDEYGRAFQIAGAIWAKFESDTAAYAGREAAHTKAFMTEFFRDALGYHAIRDTLPQTIGERTWPAMQEARAGIPLIACPWNLPLDKVDSRFAVTGEGSHKKSAFALAQGYLNASPDRDWAFVTNGLSIRLIRDSDSLVRPAYLEFDLATIMREQRFPDFCAMWRILHESRAKANIWDLWRAEGLESGTRVRDGLRNGVTRALIELGSGFLKPETPANRELHDAINSGALSISEYYRELLRLVYRFLFLFTIEERGLLHTQGDAEGNIDPALRKAQELYHSGYSMARLRDRALRASAFDRNADLWEGLRVVFRSLQSGEAKLDLPALGGIFGADQCPHLEGIQLPNNTLLSAMRNLRWAAIDGSRALIDYKNMDTEEFGSVYESLLELVPVVDLASRSFGFVGVDAETGLTIGNARKETSSYYTPDCLVQELVERVLDPVIAAKMSQRTDDPEKAILSITVIDPACGSGHFLLAAARRLAERLAEVRSNGGTKEGDYRRALREVVGQCLYGVDLNPMAIELARTALWLEGYEPGKPLGFIDHHVRCGNSLVGVTDLSVLAEGIPDEALTALPGDDKEYAKILIKKNALEQKTITDGQGLLFEDPLEKAEAGLVALHWRLANIDNESLESVQRKNDAFRKLLESDEYTSIKRACDLYTSAFFLPKKKGCVVPTSGDLSRAANGQQEDPLSPQVHAIAACDARENRYFHWYLEFPEVFSVGGFDCVLGNPPWDKINLKDEEYFASINQEIADAPTKAKRTVLIEALKTEDPDAWHAYMKVQRFHDALSMYLRNGPRFPKTGVSRINLYSVFAEHGCFLLAPTGRLGYVLASGIATDDNNKDLFWYLVDHSRLAFVYDFENRESIFKDVDSRYKFALLAVTGTKLESSQADFAFYLTNMEQLGETERHCTLTREELYLLNPNTKTCPTFRNRAEAELTKYIYKRIPAWELQEKTDEWPGKPKTPFNMSNDSGLFVTADELVLKEGDGKTYLPLYESKFTHQFNHRFATFEGCSGDNPREMTDDELANPEKYVKARYYLDKNILEKRYEGRWFLTYRKIARATDERTCITAILPQVPCGHSLALIEGLNPSGVVKLCADTNSIVHDYCCRQKVAGTNFDHWIWHQIPLVTVARYGEYCAWDQQTATNYTWLLPRVLELVYTAYDLTDFAEAVGWRKAPFKWNAERRFMIQCELDAAYFHWYLGTTDEWRQKGGMELLAHFPTPRDAARYILDSFPIVNNRDQNTYGELRTKTTILRMYDAMADAMLNGTDYRSELDPPPGDERACHGK
jgi:hypothetical protein